MQSGVESLFFKSKHLTTDISLPQTREKITIEMLGIST